MRYEEYSDEELIQIMTGEDHSNRTIDGKSAVTSDDIVDYLCEKYKSVVSRRALPLFIIGGDRDDLQQEGMIGLFKAIRSYNENRGATFRTFATRCIDRQMYTAIEKSRRKKNSPLNSYISLNQREEDGNGILVEVLPDYRFQDPQEKYARRVAISDLLMKVSELLSPLEKEVFDHLIEEETADQIASYMGKPRKSIENAINRIRIKGKDVVTANE